MQICSKCKRTKLDSSFYVAPLKLSGLQSWCKACIKIASDSIAEKRRVALAASRAKWAKIARENADAQ